MKELTIPLKPLSVNRAWQGKRFKSPEYNQYENDFMRVVKRSTPEDGLIEVEYKFYVKNHKMSDYDNFIKQTQDLLVKMGYIKDDRFIYKATIYKIPSKEEKIEVKISPFSLPV